MAGRGRTPGTAAGGPRVPDDPGPPGGRYQPHPGGHRPGSRRAGDRPGSRTERPESRTERPGSRPAGDRAGQRPAADIEFLFLPGLGPVVEAELRQRLPGTGHIRPVPGRDDSLTASYAGPWEPLLGLRTVVAPFLVLTFPVPRPRSLTSGEYLPGIVEAIRVAQRANPVPVTEFRIDAAGIQSPGYRRLAAALAGETGLAEVPSGGQVLLRFRRSVRAGGGWDVLVRLSARPLSSRPWRVRDFPGAANATIAAAMSMLTAPAPGDRVANLMCGSGTLLIERLLAAPARAAVGVERDPAAVAACLANLDAAGLRGRARILTAAIEDTGWARHGPFDVILADPPWGTLTGDHATSEAVHASLLARAHAAAAAGARLAVLTHEVRIMERCLRQAAGRWALREVLRVYQKGHHPRIYLLVKR
jgi:tRNA (guanine6-N2)-methyltransferase